MCKFDVAWVGRCKSEPEADYCSKHVEEKCRICGEQATHECPETFQFVCGFPLCDNPKCKVRHHPNQYKFTLKEWSDIYELPVMILPDNGNKVSFDKFKETVAAPVMQGLEERFQEAFKNFEGAFGYGTRVIIKAPAPYDFISFEAELKIR